MNKTRLEAFSDGVLAIIVTIMVLEIKVPHEATMQALLILGPVFISYLLSFVFVSVYWINHHHYLHTVKHINGKIIWANMLLLFSLSLIPFTTGWMGENFPVELPVVLYCVNLFFCGFAAYVFQIAVTAGMSKEDKVFEIIKTARKKTYFSVAVNIISIPCAFFEPLLSLTMIVVLVIIWMLPDKRIEQLLNEEEA